MDEAPTTSPIIKIDLGNTELIGRLKLKLEEYVERIERHDVKSPYAAPEALRDPIRGTSYKKRVIEELLKTGDVNTWELSRILEREEGGVDKKRYENACAVVDDYVTTEGAEVSGGALPKLSH